MCAGKGLCREGLDAIPLPVGLSAIRAVGPKVWWGRAPADYRNWRQPAAVACRYRRAPLAYRTTGPYDAGVHLWPRQEPGSGGVAIYPRMRPALWSVRVRHEPA